MKVQDYLLNKYVAASVFVATTPSLAFAANAWDKLKNGIKSEVPEAINMLSYIGALASVFFIFMGLWKIIEAHTNPQSQVKKSHGWIMLCGGGALGALLYISGAFSGIFGGDEGSDPISKPAEVGNWGGKSSR